MNYEKKYLKYKKKYLTLKKKLTQNKNSLQKGGNHNDEYVIPLPPLKWQFTNNDYIEGIASAKSPNELMLAVTSPNEYNMARLQKEEDAYDIDNIKRMMSCGEGNNDLEKCLDLGCNYWRGGKCRKKGTGPPEEVLREMEKDRTMDTLPQDDKNIIQDGEWADLNEVPQDDKGIVKDGEWVDLYKVGDGCISLSNDPKKCCADSRCGLNIAKNIKTCRRKDALAKNNMNNSC